jgi:hypothetical protein
MNRKARRAAERAGRGGSRPGGDQINAPALAARASTARAAWNYFVWSRREAAFF